jgi:hypothetical protein
MRKFNNRERVMCLALWSCLIVFLVIAPVRAEDQSRDGQMIEPQTETQVTLSQDSMQQSETGSVEVGKALETPMKTPEGEDGTLKEFITPNISDFETARESDMQSSVSF